MVDSVNPTQPSFSEHFLIVFGFTQKGKPRFSEKPEALTDAWEQTTSRGFRIASEVFEWKGRPKADGALDSWIWVSMVGISGGLRIQPLRGRDYNRDLK
jgi:hypothetical protein